MYILLQQHTSTSTDWDQQLSADTFGHK